MISSIRARIRTSGRPEIERNYKVTHKMRKKKKNLSQPRYILVSFIAVSKI